MHEEASLIDRAVLRAARSRHLDRFAIRAILRANELLGLAIGVRLAELRDSDDRLAASFAGAHANALQARLFSEAAEILRERWDRLPERRRPHYKPEQRFRILRIRRLLGLSAQETARWFRISSDTVLRWERDIDARPADDMKEGESEAAKLVRTTPPVRRYADVVRSLVQSMALAGFGGHAKIARVLARAGWTISKRTVGRIRSERPVSPPTHSSSEDPVRDERPVRAQHPNHVTLLDITQIPGLFGLFRFRLAVVLDVFSRMPLAWQTFATEPSSGMLMRLVERAISRFGPPSILITDQGSQFRAGPFLDFVRRIGIEPRFGAVGQSGSIAIIERFWNTLKDELHLETVRSLVKSDLDERLRLGLIHYAVFRPHQSLEGATPIEAFLAMRAPPSANVAQPPRGRPGEGPAVCPFAIRFLDKEQRLPHLVRNAA